MVRKNLVRACKSEPITFRNVRSWAIYVQFRHPGCCALLAGPVFGPRGPSPTGRPRRTSSGGVGGREPFPAKAVGPVPGAEGQASAGRRVHPLDDGGPESMLRLAEPAGERRSRHPPALAPPVIPPLLALEGQDGGPTAPPRNLQTLLREMAADNPTWGQERIANELQINWQPGLPLGRSRSIVAVAARCARQTPSSAG